MTTHNTHNRQTSVPPVGFEPTISAGERPKTYALDRTATRIGIYTCVCEYIYIYVCVCVCVCLFVIVCVRVCARAGRYICIYIYIYIESKTLHIFA